MALQYDVSPLNATWPSVKSGLDLLGLNKRVKKDLKKPENVIDAKYVFDSSHLILIQSYIVCFTGTFDRSTSHWNIIHI